MKNISTQPHHNKYVKHNSLNTTNGKFVKHAVTGDQKSYIIGHISEKKMFRVMNCTGKNDEPVKLFFTDPEEYERVRNITVDTFTKNKWRNEHLNMGT